MRVIVLLIMLSLWIMLRFFLKTKLQISKKNGGYKHERKEFAVLFYVVIAVGALVPLIYPTVNFFLLFPFIGVLVNLLFSVEQWIYKRDSKRHLLYLFDAAHWLVFGMTAFLFFA